MMLDEDRFRDELKHDYLSTMHPASSTKALLCDKDTRSGQSRDTKQNALLNRSGKYHASI